MLVSTTSEISEKKISRTLGVFTGSTIRAKHIGKDIIAGLRNIVGGELKEYTEMMREARKEAFERMIENAQEMGADAVVGMRFSTSMVTSHAAEILAYGTAVKLK